MAESEDSGDVVSGAVQRVQRCTQDRRPKPAQARSSDRDDAVTTLLRLATLPAYHSSTFSTSTDTVKRSLWPRRSWSQSV